MKTLPELLLKLNYSNSYTCQTGEIVYHTKIYEGNPRIFSHCRGKTVVPDLINYKDADRFFIDILEAASSVKHDTFNIVDIKGLNVIASTLIDQDCVPNSLIVPEDTKIPEFQKEYITISSCARSMFCAGLKIGVKCKLNVIKTKLINVDPDKADSKSYAYMVSIPEVLGRVNVIDNKISILIRPVGCVKIVFE